MNCLICHKSVEDQGETLPEVVHLDCVPRWMSEIEQAERAMFAASIPRGPTIRFRRFAPLTTQDEPGALDS